MNDYSRVSPAVASSVFGETFELVIVRYQALCTEDLSREIADAYFTWCVTVIARHAREVYDMPELNDVILRRERHLILMRKQAAVGYRVVPLSGLGTLVLQELEQLETRIELMRG